MMLNKKKQYYKNLNDQIIKLEINLKSKIESINNAKREFYVLRSKSELSKEKFLGRIYDLDNKAKDINILLKKFDCLIERLKQSIDRNELPKKLNKNANQLSLQCIEYNVNLKEVVCYILKCKIECIRLFEKELSCSKSIENIKLEDTIVNEVLHECVSYGDIEKTKELIDVVEKIRLKRSFKFTNLSKVIDKANNNFCIIKIIIEQLIQQKEEYNITDPAGYTMLHRAVVMGHFPTIELIVEELSKENKDINPKKNNTDLTPLHFAIEKGKISIVDMFLKELLKKMQVLNPQDSEGYTPLHVAARKDDLFIFKKLLTCFLENGQEINPASKIGLTPLHLVAGRSDFAMFDLLLDSIECQGGDLNPSLILDKKTVLHVLAEKGDVKLFKKLLEKLIKKNEEINPIEINERTPLHVAIEYNHEEIVKILTEKIKIEKGELFFKSLCGETVITPFYFAAYNGRLNLVDYFLKENIVSSTEYINPMTKEGKTLIQLAMVLKNREVVKKILELILDSENAGLTIEEICESFVFTNKVESLDQTLESIKNRANYFENFCIGLLTYISVYRHNEMAGRFFAFLSQKKDFIFTDRIIKQVKNKDILNLEDRKYLLEMKKFVDRTQRKTNELCASKVSSFKKILTEQEMPIETINKNKSYLEEVQKKYNVLLATIQQGIKGLENSRNEKIIEEKSKALMGFIKPMILDYTESRNDFFIKEEKLRSKAKSKVNQLLRPFIEKMEFSTELLEKSKKATLSKKSEKTQSENLNLKIKNLIKARTACQLEIDKVHDVLSPSIQNTFKILTEYSRALLEALIIFGGEDKKNEEKDIAKKKQKEDQTLDKEIEKSKEILSHDLKALYCFIEEATAYFEKIDPVLVLINDSLQEKVRLLKLGLLNSKEKLSLQEEKQKTIFLKNKEEKKILKDALQKHIQESSLNQEKNKLEWEASLIKTEVFDCLYGKRKTLEKEWLIKVEEIKLALSSVLNHALYNSIISNKEDILYSSCERYKKHFDFLEKSQLSLYSFDSENDFSKEYKRMVDLRKDVLKKNQGLTEKRKEINFLVQELNSRLLNSTKDKVVVIDQKLGKAYVPSFQENVEPKTKDKNKKKNKKGNVEVFSAFSKEIQYANELIELLKADDKKEIGLNIKKNALLLSVATVCESLKRSEKETLFKKRAIEVRDAIYHGLIEEKGDEEKYKQLFNFVVMLCSKSMINKLENFFDIFPRVKLKPEDRHYKAIINIHIQSLEQYFEKIENGQLDIENNLVLQSDVAFRLAQIGALRTDLNKRTDRQDQFKEMFKKLNMKKAMFHELANGVRHKGVEGVKTAIEEYLMAIGSALSKRDFHQNKRDQNSAEKLIKKMARLSL